MLIGVDIRELPGDAPILAGDLLEFSGAWAPLIGFLAPEPEEFLRDRILEAQRALLDEGVDSDVDRSRKLGDPPLKRAKSIIVTDDGVYVWDFRLVLIAPEPLPPGAAEIPGGPVQEAGLVPVLLAAAALVAALAALGATWGRTTLTRITEEVGETARTGFRAIPWIVAGAIALAVFSLLPRSRAA